MAMHWVGVWLLFSLPWVAFGDRAESKDDGGETIASDTWIGGLVNVTVKTKIHLTAGTIFNQLFEFEAGGGEVESYKSDKQVYEIKSGTMYWVLLNADFLPGGAFKWMFKTYAVLELWDKKTEKESWMQHPGHPTGTMTEDSLKHVHWDESTDSGVQWIYKNVIVQLKNVETTNFELSLMANPAGDFAKKIPLTTPQTDALTPPQTGALMTLQTGGNKLFEYMANGGFLTDDDSQTYIIKPETNYYCLFNFGAEGQEPSAPGDPPAPGVYYKWMFKTPEKNLLLTDWLQHPNHPDGDLSPISKHSHQQEWDETIVKGVAWDSGVQWDYTSNEEQFLRTGASRSTRIEGKPIKVIVKLTVIHNTHFTLSAFLQ